MSIAENRLKQARAIASQVHRERYVALKGITLPNQSSNHLEMAEMIDAGEMDDCIAVRSALAAHSVTHPDLAGHVSDAVIDATLRHRKVLVDFDQGRAIAADILAVIETRTAEYRATLAKADYA